MSYITEGISLHILGDSVILLWCDEKGIFSLCVCKKERSTVENGLAEI